MRDLALPFEADAPAGTATAALLPIAVEDLGLETGGARLIEDVSFRLATPGITVIMGPNGAGKSVLLRLLHGLVMPTTGRIEMGGFAMGPAITRRQSLVFQKPVLLRRSVAANLDFVLKSRRAASAARRDALLAEVGLAGKGAQPARLLSGGEQQRLALARALATDPEVLFLDEPTASLDPASVQAIEAIVTKAANRGVKAIWVTHDIGQARRLATDVLFLSKGRLAEHSRADTFFDAPVSDAACAYLDGRLVL